MITIGRLIPTFTGNTGGPYNHIMELTPELEKLGVNTKVFTTSYIAQVGRRRTQFFEKKSDLFSIYKFNSFLRFKEYRISLGLIRYLLKDAKNINIFHSHALRSFQEDIGSIVCLIKKKPLIITTHGSIGINWDYGDKIPKVLHDISLGYLKKKFLNAHFIAVARNEIPIIQKYGIEDDHIHYIPHGINTELFKPTNSSDLVKKYNLEGKDIILYVGRIAKGKGVDILIKLLNLIVQKNKNVKLLIVGEDSGYSPIVNSLIQKYNISKYIIFTGFIPKINLPSYYSMADLVIYPSRQEIFGHVITEAGACEKAVIGSDIMGPSEIIDNHNTGFTSNFENLDELSELVLDLLKDKERLKVMGKSARKRVQSLYSWKKAAETHLDLYKMVLN
ncbi:MAG: glycosyltransferase family 4 protein [Candidatus Lokiarchaeota archaeon]|nr:glycosyltransferase family 4 protein [Candidatus Lokiarchaeota archaeon]